MLVYNPRLDIYGIIVKREEYLIRGRVVFLDIAKVISTRKKSDIGCKIAVLEDDIVFEELMVE